MCGDHHDENPPECKKIITCVLTADPYRSEDILHPASPLCPSRSEIKGGLHRIIGTHNLSSVRNATGKVYLVGAGPGDRELITLKGARLIQQADCIVYDALINPSLLDLAKPETELIFAGKHPHSHTLSQQALNELLVTKAQEGLQVVRLKGGDPLVFGRGGEEAAALNRETIPFELVPGVSSVIAVPAYAGIPLTHRHVSSSFSVFTGRSNPETAQPDYPWEAIAQTPGTKVLLMCVERLETLATSLIDHGMDPATPGAMISWGTYGRQRCVTAPLSKLAPEATAAKLTSPSIVILGEVVNLRDELNWFEKKPLFARRIVITRHRSQKDELTDRLLEMGAEILPIPTIQFAPPSQARDLVESLIGLGEYDWIIFTSARGVEAFFEAFFKAYKDVRSLGNVRLAAVGPATASRIQAYHLEVDAMPSSHQAEHILEAITGHESIENLRILLARAEVANPKILKGLEEKGAIVDDIACYQTIAASPSERDATETLHNQGADWITFASGSAVRHFHERFDLADLLETYPSIKIASIGPETSSWLRQLELNPTVEASEHTGVGLANAIAEYELRASLE